MPMPAQPQQLDRRSFVESVQQEPVADASSDVELRATVELLKNQLQQLRTFLTSQLELAQCSIGEALLAVQDTPMPSHAEVRSLPAQDTPMPSHAEVCSLPAQERQQEVQPEAKGQLMERGGRLSRKASAASLMGVTATSPGSMGVTATLPGSMATSPGYPSRQCNSLSMGVVQTGGSNRRPTIRQFTSHAVPAEMVLSGQEASDDDWPRNLALRQIGLQADATRQFVEMDADLQQVFTKSGSMMEETVTRGEAVGRWQLCWREPDSIAEQTFNMIGIFVLSYDLLCLPFLLAWDFQIEGALVILTWISLIFWTIDMLLSFVTGFYDEGELNMKLSAAACHYCKTWFLPDAMVVVSEWMSVCIAAWAKTSSSMDSSMKTLRVARFVKLGRILRLLAILRVFRAMRMIEVFIERNLSELQRMSLRVFTIAICWLWVNHILACLWFAVGMHAPSDTGARWVDLQLDHEPLGFTHTGVMFQYTTALHWSIAQTTLGSMEVFVTNTFERVFNVLCLLMGLFFGSSLISSLSATMVDFRMSVQIKSNRMSLLRRYLLENHVNKKVALMVQHQAAARLSDDAAMLAPKDVPALESLSRGLRYKLHAAIYQTYLLQHQLWTLFSHLDFLWFERACFHAVDMNYLRSEDDLFLPGGDCLTIYYLISGSLDYNQVPESSQVLMETTRLVYAGTWLCEAALWVDWFHVGKAEATSTCQVLMIRIPNFVSAMTWHYTIRAIAAEFGRLFHERVTAAKAHGAIWPDDIHVPHSDFGDLVVAMPGAMQVTIGKMAIRSWKPKNFWSQQNVQKELRQEVEDGRSIVILTSAGELQRVVSVAVVRIMRPDGAVLVQMARWRGGEAVADLQLPAAKCKRDESSDQAMRRLLATKLAPLAQTVEVTGTSRDMSEHDSPEFGVRTVYMKKLFFASFCGSLNAPLCTLDRPTAMDSTGTIASKASGPDVLDQISIYFVGSQEAGVFISWLHDEQLRRLQSQSSAAERDLSRLMPPLPPLISTL